MQLKHLVIYPFALLFLLLPTQGAQMVEGDNNDLSGQYVHGRLENYEKVKVMEEIDKNEVEALHAGLINMYRDGVARPITEDMSNRVPVYFVVGPTGAGKSTFIFALQGNEVKKKKLKGRTWRERRQENKGQNLEFITKVQGDTPEIGCSAKGVTVGSKIYYPGEDNRDMAFCDTEGFLGRREVNSHTEKLMSAFYPHFTLKANRIGGIVILVSAIDIEASRGENFRTCASFIKEYFAQGRQESNLQELKKSVMLLITKGDNIEDRIADQLLMLIQDAYQDYYKELTTKDSKGEEAMGDLKHFLRLFLEHDVAEDKINDIENFELSDNVDFFYPYEIENVQAIAESLCELQLPSHRYLLLGDSHISQYLVDKLIYRAYEINTIVSPALHYKRLAYLQSLLLKLGNKQTAEFEQQLKAQKKELQAKNVALLNSEELECIYQDSHIEDAPLYTRDEMIKTAAKIGALVGGFALGGVFLYSLFAGGAAVAAVGRAAKMSSFFHDGYLRKSFVWSAEDPVCRIDIHAKNGGISWIEPKEDFIRENFDFTQNENLDQFTSKRPEGITLERCEEKAWQFCYTTAYKQNADCHICFYSKKAKLGISKWKIEDNNNNITSIDNCLAYACSTNDIDKIRQDHQSSKVAFENERQRLVGLQEEMEMIYFWSTHIFDNKLSKRELILQYVQNYEEAIGKQLMRYNGHEVENLTIEPTPDEPESKEDNPHAPYLATTSLLAAGAGAAVASLRK